MKKIGVFIIVFFLLTTGVIYASSSIRKPESSGEDGVRKVIELAMDSERCTNMTKVLINNFNENNIYNIEVRLKEFPTENYNDTINMLMTSGKGVDIFQVNTEWLTGYIYNEWLMDISDVMDKHILEYYPAWVKVFISNQSNSGKIFTFPSTEATFRMIYNKNLLILSDMNPDTPPATFKDLRDCAKKITSENAMRKKYGFAFPMGDEWTRINYLVEAPSSYSGLYFYDYDSKEYDLSVYKDWLNLILEMKKSGTILPAEDNLTSSTIVSQFAKGNVAITFISSRELPRLLSKIEKGLEWGVAFPPAANSTLAAKGKVIKVPDMMFGINEKTEHAREAMLVWQYLYSEEFLAPLFRSGSGIPLDSRILENRANYPSNQQVLKFLPSEKDEVYPLTPLYDDVWFRFRAYDAVLKQGKDVEEALLETSIQLNRMLMSKFKK
jgi:multiple sugar transport system substrate-binding protein